MAHADLSSNQYIFANGRYKLNDFNFARLLMKNTTDESKNCPYYFHFKIGNVGNLRSPEEYRFDELTEKTDVYAFGNILYTLLHRQEPFDGEDEVDTATRLMTGTRAAMSQAILASKDTATMALRNATDWCFAHDPLQRPTIQEVRVYLESVLEELDPGRIKSWQEQWLPQDQSR